MPPSFRVAVVALTLATGLIAAGCGADASLSPIGPSAGTAGSNGAVISGVVTGAGAAASTMSSESTFGTLGTSSSIKVTVTGTNISTTTDGQGRFTLTGVPGGNVEIQFTSPSGTAKITLSGVSSSDRIEITVSLNGNNARVDAEHRHRDDNGVEANGRITAVDTSARTLRVGTTQVRVPPTAVIRHGSRVLAFADLHVGDHVEVKGTVESGVLVASEVKVEQDDDDDGRDDANEVELKGTVSALSGTCPSLTFTIQNTKVVTSASTSFREVTCAAIAGGTVKVVEVKGTRRSDGSVAATRVERED
jgi:hypothetical protein